MSSEEEGLLRQQLNFRLGRHNLLKFGSRFVRLFGPSPTKRVTREAPLKWTMLAHKRPTFSLPYNLRSEKGTDSERPRERGELLDV